MSISLNENSKNLGILQRDNLDSRTVTICGTYDGIRQVQIRLIASNGTVLFDWINAELFSTSLFFKYPLVCSYGLYYKAQARYSGDDSTVVTQENIWGIGSLLAIAGESNGSELFYHGTSISPLFPYHKEYRKLPSLAGENPGKVWSSPYSNGVVSIANEIYSTSPSLPLGFIELSQDGTTISNFNNPSHDCYKRIAETLNEVGNIEYFILVIGANDAANGTSKSDFKNGLISFHSHIISLLGKESSSFIFVIVKVGSVALSGATTARVQAIREAQEDFASETEGVYIGGSIEGLALSDGTHLQRNLQGSGSLGSQIGNFLKNWS